MREVIARANSNVAFAKYWGKRNAALNLPYTGSLSVTLAGLSTTVRAQVNDSLPRDRVSFDGCPAIDSEATRVRAFLDLVRQAAERKAKLEVDVCSNFPVAAGLASSASIFAALAVAATRVFGLSLTDRELSLLARRGSGSAARSVFGGYVEWFAGESTDGTDSFAEQIAPPDHWNLGVVVAITADGPKAVGSREGMDRAVKQSPFFPGWLESHDLDLETIRRAIVERDFVALGRAAERNCLKMHAVAMATDPPLLYWNPATVAVMQSVWRLREQGADAFFSIDAGPQVKVFCPCEQRADIASALNGVDGVQRTILSEPGDGAELVEPR